MSENLRIFIRNESSLPEGQQEVLKLAQEDILKGAYIEEGYSFMIHPDNIKELQQYKDVGGLTVSEEDLKNCIIFTAEDMNGISNGDKFFELLEAYNSKENFEIALKEFNEYEVDEQLTQADLDLIFNQIRENLDTADCWIDAVEYHEYWDGSNHKKITLSGEYAEFTEVDNAEYNDYVSKERLDAHESGAYCSKLVITESGKKAVVTSSRMQGDCTVVWEFVGNDIESLEDLRVDRREM